MEQATRTPSADSQMPEEGNPDLSSFLDAERKNLQAQFKVRPLTDEERRVSEDIRWAIQDTDVQTQYQGEVVVPFEHRIVAHGHHAATVLAEAARLTGRRIDELPLVTVISPLLLRPKESLAIPTAAA